MIGIQLGIKLGGLMNKIDAGRMRDFFEIKAVAGQRRLRVGLRFVGISARPKCA